MRSGSPVDVLNDVGGCGVGHGLGLPAAVDGEPKVDPECSSPEDGEHGDGGQDEDGAALLFAVHSKPVPGASDHETVPSCTTLVEEIVEGVTNPRPGSSGKRGLSL